MTEKTDYMAMRRGFYASCPVVDGAVAARTKTSKTNPLINLLNKDGFTHWRGAFFADFNPKRGVIARTGISGGII